MKIELTIPDKDTADELERVISSSNLFLLQTGPDAYSIHPVPSWVQERRDFREEAQVRCNVLNERCKVINAVSDQRRRGL